MKSSCVPFAVFVLLVSALALTLNSTSVQESLTPGQPFLTETDSLYLRAVEYRNSVRFDEARRILEKLIYLSDQSQEYVQRSAYRIELAELLIEQGKYEESIRVLDYLLDDSLKYRSQLESVRAICTRAEALIRSGDYQNAENAVHDCQKLEISLNSRKPTLEAYSEHLQGHLYQVQGKFPMALDHLQQALIIKSRVYGTESLEYARTLEHIASIHYSLGANDLSIKEHLETLKIREDLLPSNHPELASSYGNLGNCFHLAGDYDKSLEYHVAAIGIWDSVFGDNHVETALSHNNLGLTYLAQNQLELAEAAFQIAAKIIRNRLGSNHPTTLSTMHRLSEVYQKQHSIDRAKLMNQHVLEGYENQKLESHPEYLEAKVLRARLAFEEGRHGSSINQLKATIELAKSNNHSALPKFSNDLAELYLNSGELESTLEQTQQSLSFNIRYDLGNSPESNPIIGVGYDVPELLRSLIMKGTSLSKLSDRSGSKSHLVQSLKAYERALEIAVYTRRLSSAQQSRNTINVAIDEMADGAISVALKLFNDSKDDRFLDKVFQFVEFKKAGNFFDALTDAQAKSIANVPDSLIEKELNLRNEIAAFDRHKSQLAEVNDNDKYLTGIQQKRFLTSKQLDNLLTYTERIYPRYYTLKQIVTYASIDTVINTLLNDYTQLVQYFYSDNSLNAIVVTDSGASLYNLGKKEVIQDKIDEYDTLFTDKYDRNTFDYLYQLYEILMEPIVSHHDKENIIIIPEADMRSIPFDALLTSPVDLSKGPLGFTTDIPFLVKQYLIGIGYSATLMIEQTKLPPVNYKKLFLGIAPVFDQNDEVSTSVASFLQKVAPREGQAPVHIEPLKGSLNEIIEIQSIMESREHWFGNLFFDQTELRFRKRVTESGLKSTDLSAYRYLHFATHSFADQENPINSGILLETNGQSGEDGILHASEIIGFNAKSELVVLSSCNSAFNSGSESAGLSGFVLGFIFAGARNIVASLWPSDDIATTLLMTQFYGHLSNKHAIAHSLRMAKLQLIASKSPISHPYYWAGFVHIGSSIGSAAHLKLSDGRLARN